MRRNRELNTWEKKDLARRKYAERQLQKFIDWSIEAKDKVYGNSINGLPYYVSAIAS